MGLLNLGLSALGVGSSGSLNIGSMLGGALGVKDLSCLGGQAFNEAKYNDYMALLGRYVDDVEKSKQNIETYNWFFDTWCRELKASELLIAGYRSACSKEWHTKALNQIKQTLQTILQRVNYNVVQKTGVNRYVNNGNAFTYEAYNVLSFRTDYLISVANGNSTPVIVENSAGSTVTTTTSTTSTNMSTLPNYIDDELGDDVKNILPISLQEMSNDLTIPNGTVTIGNSTVSWGTNEPINKDLLIIGGLILGAFILTKKKK